VSVYFKFEEKDILWAVVTTTPRIVLASGSAGWHGNIGPSSSLSLYEGVRARTDVYNGAPSGINLYPLDPVDTNSIDKVIFVSGSYPSTGSVHFVKARNTDVGGVAGAADFLITSDDWYQEHFNPVVGLFDYYSRVNSQYFTGSYDFYSLFFWQTLPRTGSFVTFSGSLLPTVSSSFTLEVQAKPMHVTGSNDFVLQSQKGRFKFYITGSTGQLAFSDGATILTSSVALQRGVWADCLFVANGSSASFYINTGSAGTYAYTGTLAVPLTASGFLVVGSELITSSSVTGVGTSSFTASTLFPFNSYFGYIYDSRIWSRALTQAQVSGTWNQVNLTSGSDPTFVHYARFNDGPQGHAHPYVQGSGAFDYGFGASPLHGDFHNFNIALPVSPTWQPVDNPNSIGTLTRIDDEVDFFRIVHVPSMFYGRQIATGSVYMVCNAYMNKGIQRVVQDDGHGRLYVSGSMTRQVSGENFTGLRWNKVGNVFYNEGLIVITDPSFFDFGAIGRDASLAFPDTLQIAFSGQEKLTTKVFQCRIGAGKANGSNNPTFSSLNMDPKSQFYNKHMVKNSPPTTWISAVGIYNEDHKLVAVAKLASPIRKREKDKLLIRLRMDF
jgi:hypothetical protein